jgi:hypothetical protein
MQHEKNDGTSAIFIRVNPHSSRPRRALLVGGQLPAPVFGWNLLTRGEV